VGKTTSTQFAKKKLEQKKNSLHVKNFKMPNYIIMIKNKDKKKDPLSFPKRRFQVLQKMVGILKKMKIPRNLFKLQVIQLYLSSKT
jgi:hypothetical protein